MFVSTKTIYTHIAFTLHGVGKIWRSWEILPEGPGDIWVKAGTWWPQCRQNKEQFGIMLPETGQVQGGWNPVQTGADTCPWAGVWHHWW